MNKADSERIKVYLEKKGYKKAVKKEQADLIVVNMCSIRQSAVDRVLGLNRNLVKLKIIKPKIKIILTGCILEKDKKKFKFDEIRPKKDYLKFEAKYKNSSLAYIPVSNGCNNFCSYCVVPFTRGPLICYQHKKIIKQAKKAIKQGVKEIWLLGQNVNDYQSPTDSKINFSRLIKMIDALPGTFKFFFISPHPKNFSNQLINVLWQAKNFGKYLNLPLQSGDNQILKKMNRNYSIKQYKALVEKIRKKIPGIKLSTDVIVGFPGESKKQFQNTIKLFKQINFDWAYISKYSQRPDTAASKLEDNISWPEKKKREKILREIINKNE